MPESNETRALFLDLLRCAVHGESFDGPLSREATPAVARLAREHSVLPLLVEAGGAPLHGYAAHARRLTISQAGHTADFLLLYAFLNERGLYLSPSLRVRIPRTCTSRCLETASPT